MPAQADWVRTDEPEGGYINALSASGTRIFAGTDGGVFFSANNGTNWTAVNFGNTSSTVFSLAVNGSNVLAGTDESIFISADNGTNWTAVNAGLANTVVLSLAARGDTVCPVR